MKAIQITEENKVNFNGNIGDIVTIQRIPNTYIKDGLTIHNYKSLSDSDLQEDGFYDVEPPVYDTETQYLGGLYLDVDKFKYTIEDYTAEEIAAKAESKANNAINMTYNNHEDNGKAVYQNFRIKLIKDINASNITEYKALEVEVFLKDVFYKIRSGDWKTGLFLVNQLVTEDSIFMSYKSYILDIINDYITNNY